MDGTTGDKSNQSETMRAYATRHEADGAEISAAASAQLRLGGRQADMDELAKAFGTPEYEMIKLQILNRLHRAQKNIDPYPKFQKKPRHDWDDDHLGSTMIPLYILKEDLDRVVIKEGADGIWETINTKSGKIKYYRDTKIPGAVATKKGSKFWISYNPAAIDEMYKKYKAGVPYLPEGSKKGVVPIRSSDMSKEEFRMFIMQHERLHLLLGMGDGVGDENMLNFVALIAANRTQDAWNHRRDMMVAKAKSVENKNAAKYLTDSLKQIQGEKERPFKKPATRTFASILEESRKNRPKAPSMTLDRPVRGLEAEISELKQAEKQVRRTLRQQTPGEQDEAVAQRDEAEINLRGKAKQLGIPENKIIEIVDSTKITQTERETKVPVKPTPPDKPTVDPLKKDKYEWSQDEFSDIMNTYYSPMKTDDENSFNIALTIKVMVDNSGDKDKEEAFYDTMEKFEGKDAVKFIGELKDRLFNPSPFVEPREQKPVKLKKVNKEPLAHDIIESIKKSATWRDEDGNIQVGEGRRTISRSSWYKGRPKVGDIVEFVHGTNAVRVRIESSDKNGVGFTLLAAKELQGVGPYKRYAWAGERDPDRPGEPKVEPREKLEYPLRRNIPDSKKTKMERTKAYLSRNALGEIQYQKGGKGEEGLKLGVTEEDIRKVFIKKAEEETPEKPETFSIVPTTSKADTSGMRGAGKHMNTPGIKPGQAGWLGNPYKWEGNGGPKGVTVEDVIGKFRQDFNTKINSDIEFRNAVVNLRGKKVGYYKPNDRNHLEVVRDWLASDESKIKTPDDRKYSYDEINELITGKPGVIAEDLENLDFLPMTKEGWLNEIRSDWKEVDKDPLTGKVSSYWQQLEARGANPERILSNMIRPKEDKAQQKWEFGEKKVVLDEAALEARLQELGYRGLSHFKQTLQDEQRAEKKAPGAQRGHKIDLVVGEGAVEVHVDWNEPVEVKPRGEYDAYDVRYTKKKHGKVQPAYGLNIPERGGETLKSGETFPKKREAIEGPDRTLYPGGLPYTHDEVGNKVYLPELLRGPSYVEGTVPVLPAIPIRLNLPTLFNPQDLASMKAQDIAMLKQHEEALQKPKTIKEVKELVKSPDYDRDLYLAEEREAEITAHKKQFPEESSGGIVYQAPWGLIKESDREFYQKTTKGIINVDQDKTPEIVDKALRSEAETRERGQEIREEAARPMEKRGILQDADKEQLKKTGMPSEELYSESIGLALGSEVSEAMAKAAASRVAAGIVNYYEKHVTELGQAKEQLSRMAPGPGKDAAIKQIEANLKKSKKWWADSKQELTDYYRDNTHEKSVQQATDYLKKSKWKQKKLDNIDTAKSGWSAGFGGWRGKSKPNGPSKLSILFNELQDTVADLLKTGILYDNIAKPIW